MLLGIHPRSPTNGCGNGLWGFVTMMVLLKAWHAWLCRELVDEKIAVKDVPKDLKKLADKVRPLG